MKWLMWTGLLAGSLTLIAAGLAVYGDRRWNDATQPMSDALEASRADRQALPQLASRYDPRELDGLPAPVQRYFRTVLKPGQPIIAAATFEMTGNFNLSSTGEQWKPFTSRQRIVTRRPGFLWDARIAMLPGLPVRVVDSYIAGRGLLHAAALGLYTVADVAGGDEIASGEFMRFFAEAPWYPTALLPSQGVRWTAVDERSANATMTDGPLQATLLFRFNDAGLIDSFFAAGRSTLDGKKFVLVPWEGRWSNYQTPGGMTVPLTGEVAWLRTQGRRSYFVGTVNSLSYEFIP